MLQTGLCEWLKECHTGKGMKDFVTTDLVDAGYERIHPMPTAGCCRLANVVSHYHL